LAKLHNLARMSTATTGTGTITLGSAVAGFLSFGDAGVANGSTVTYGIRDGTSSEIGRGVYTSSGTTLTRTVLKSTNSNNAISLSGTAQVFITPASEDVIENTGQMFTPPGRLTLTSGIPILSSTVSGAATIYYTPYLGNVIWLYDGTSRWEQFEISELSLALSVGTASRPHDVFIYSSLGTPTLELTAWTNDTTRATNLAFQNGRYVKSGATTRLYVGTIYLDASKQCSFIVGGLAAGGTAGVVGLWNMYNRASWATLSGDTTNSWTYTDTANWRSANASSTMRTSFINGVSGGVTVDACYQTFSIHTGNAGRVAIGYDSATVPADFMLMASSSDTTLAHTSGVTVRTVKMATAGYHYVQAIELGSANVTFYGDVGLTTAQSGMNVTGQY